MLEKVVKGLELCRYDPDPGMPTKTVVSCDACPWWTDTFGCDMVGLLNATLAVVKLQEPIKPRDSTKFSNSGKIIPAIQCGNCSKEIYKIYDFCPFCGHKILWK